MSNDKKIADSNPHKERGYLFSIGQVLVAHERQELNPFVDGRQELDPFVEGNNYPRDDLLPIAEVMGRKV